MINDSDKAFTVLAIDKRFSWHQFFDYVVQYPTDMSQKQGPLEFARTCAWLTETYGPSVEITIWDTLKGWEEMHRSFNLPSETTEFTNDTWSWSLQNPKSLRIYLKDKETLSWFLLKNQ